MEVTMTGRPLMRKFLFLLVLFSLNSCVPVCSTGSLQSPNLLSPSDFSIVASLLPELSWAYPDAGCHPMGYRIDLSPDRDFADTSLSGGTGNPSTTWFPGSDLQPGREYFWRVAAINNTTLGPYSAYRRFFTGPYCDPSALTAPTLSWPADGETIDTTMPGLHWQNGNAGCLPQGYGIRLSTDATFADTSLNGGTGNPDTYWYPGVELADCTTYYWRVFAGIDITFGPESATRSFHTDTGACAPAGTGSIAGLVFHDLCALIDAPMPTPPPGCVALGGGGYGGNGTYDPGEPGIAGVHVKLGQGTCPAATILQTAVTGADGSYSFSGLPAGTYCVFADALEADNIPVLIPGGWTHPLREVNPTAQAVLLADGEHRNGILFGWDYQFLPAPATPTPTPAALPTLTPTLTPAAFQASVKPNKIYYRGTDCGAMKAEFEVQVPDSKQTAGVWLFVRLREKDGAGLTAWGGSFVMRPLGSGRYSYRLFSQDIPEFATFADAVVQYQFVAYDSGFNRIATSHVYTDLELSVCSGNTTKA
jgi:hypothetical protein